MAPYELVLHEEAARRLTAASRAEQRRLGMILDELKNSPFRTGDLQEKDSAGRDYEILMIHDWLVTFWVDHAVREIRIVRLETPED